MTPEPKARSRRQKTDAPITLELSTDLNCFLAPDIPPDDPVELIREHTLIQRLDMRTVSNREWRRGHYWSSSETVASA
jgi:hypothetical protein